MGVTTFVCICGVSIKDACVNLKRGCTSPQIIIGTPGRTYDFIDRQLISYYYKFKLT